MMNDGAQAIRKLLRPYPKVSLAIKPTPIGVMNRVSAHLGPGHRAWVMRDDLSGFGLGGNKVRKLEYILGHALAKKVNALVTVGANSFSRNAAVASKFLGLDMHVLMGGKEADHNPLSRDFFAIMGATVHYVDPEKLPAEQRELVQALSSGGQIVQELHRGGSDTLGTLGYIEAFAEIIERMAREGVVFDQVFHASGSAATQAGLVLGQAISGCTDMRIIGIAASMPGEVQTKRVADLARATADMLGIDFDPARVIVDDRYLGEGYPIPSAASRSAVEFFARAEGILFDPIYVGKAAAALLGYARDGELGDKAKVLLLHTGGNAGVYY